MRQHILMTGIATLLAACGGSGSDQTAAPETPSAPAATAPAAQPAAPANTARVVIQGTALSTPANTTPGLGGAQTVTSSDLNILNKDGGQIALQLPGIITHDMTYLPNGVNVDGRSYGTFAVSGSRYTDSKFGYINDGAKDYIFSQGVPTATMPDTGLVSYRGEAVIAHNGAVGLADSDFLADFGLKRLMGRIIPGDGINLPLNQISIYADITGNTFKDTGGWVKARGQFYGYNGVELGGIFHDTDQNITGSFGARRE